MNETIVDGDAPLCDECKRPMTWKQKDSALLRQRAGENWDVYACEACDVVIAKPSMKKRGYSASGEGAIGDFNARAGF